MPNAVACPKCRSQNVAGMQFCTNCGSRLFAPDAAAAPPNTVVSGGLPMHPTPNPAFSGASAPKSGGTNKGLMVFGGLGCLALLLGGGALLAMLIYLGSSGAANNNADLARANRSTAANRSAAAPTGANTARNTSPDYSGSASGNDYSSNSAANNAPATADPEFDAFNFPEQMGAFEQDEAEEGDPAADFPGAERVRRAKYTKQNRTVDFMFARFASNAAAKTSYTDFVKTVKSDRAKIVTQNKIPRTRGGEPGELTIFSRNNVYETTLYTDKYGIRLVAPDRITMKAFIEDFQKYAKVFNQ